MPPDQLLPLMTSLGAAAEIVDALEDRRLQIRRGWDLSGWRYNLVVWGVQFTYRSPRDCGAEEFVAVIALNGHRLTAKADAPPHPLALTIMLQTR